MISSGVTTGMVFTLIICLFVPVVELMFLLVKKKQKKVLPLALAGGMSIILGPFIGRMILEAIFNMIIDFDKLSENYYPVYVLVISFIWAISMVGGILAGIILIKPGGITVNRLVVFSAGAQIVDSLIFTALSTMNKFTIIGYISSGTLKDMLKDSENPNAKAKEIIQNYSQIKPIDCFMEGVAQLFIFLIIMGIAFYLYKGLTTQLACDDEKKLMLITGNDSKIRNLVLSDNLKEKQMLVNAGFITIISLIMEYVYSLLLHYVNSIVAVVYLLVFALLSVYIVKNVYMENVKIKPTQSGK